MSTIEMTAEDLYDKEKVDLESVELEDVYQLLQCTEAGLSTSEVQRRLEIFGPNKLESKEVNPILQVSISRAQSPLVCGSG
jgi:H+-transporting ATPase